MRFCFYTLFSISLVGCASFILSDDFEQKIIDTPDFSILTQIRETDPKSGFVIYIEGDGNAFDARGRPTKNPTPKSKFVRRLAQDDPSPNVAYIARPCQFITDKKCSYKYWTIARFAPEVIDSISYTIKEIAGTRDVTLVGFSGGAHVAGLVAVLHPEIHVKQIVTYAGNLDHDAWTAYHKLSPLDDSLNLANFAAEYKKIPAIHYVGEKDKVIPVKLITDFIGEQGEIIIVPDAGHGW